MEDIIKLLDRVLNIDFIRAVLSNPRDKEGIIKVPVRGFYGETGISQKSGKRGGKSTVCRICGAVPPDADRDCE